MSYLRTPGQLVYVNVLEDFFWSQYNQGFAIGSTRPEDSFAYHDVDPLYEATVKNSSVYTIIDTGSNAIYFSALYYESFLRKIFAWVGGETWAMKDGIVNTLCYDFPPLYFMFDNKWIMVSPEDYVIDFSDAQDRSLCILMLFP